MGNDGGTSATRAVGAGRRPKRSRGRIIAIAVVFLLGAGALIVLSAGIASWLVFKDFNLDVCESSDKPILVAARKGDIDGVVREIDHGVDPNIVDHQHNTPLGCAIPLDREGVVRVLLDRRADPNKLTGDPANGYDEYPLELAMKQRASGRNTTMVPLLLDRGADPNRHSTKHKLPLDDAISVRDHEEIKLLLDHGANANGEGDSLPLGAAVTAADADIVKALLDHGADPNGRPGKRPLALAAKVPMVELLVSRGADPAVPFADGGPETTADRGLGLAATTGDADALHKWLALGADPNRSPADHNPLLGAVAFDHPGAVRALLDAGADPSLGRVAQDRAGSSILVGSGTATELTLNQLFEAAGGSTVAPTVDPLPAGPGGSLPANPVFTALDLAAAKGNAEVTRLLLDHGADPNDPAGGAAPLYYAARGCHANVASVLLAHRADPHGAPGTFDPATVACDAVKPLLSP